MEIGGGGSRAGRGAAGESVPHRCIHDQHRDRPDRDRGPVSGEYPVPDDIPHRVASIPVLETE